MKKKTEGKSPSDTGLSSVFHKTDEQFVQIKNAEREGSL